MIHETYVYHLELKQASENAQREEKYSNIAIPRVAAADSELSCPADITDENLFCISRKLHQIS